MKSLKLKRYTVPFAGLATVILVSLMLSSCGSIPDGEDWPTFRHDTQRSGVSSESIDVTSLSESWAYHSPAAPNPAWSGPAKWDAYAKVNGLRSMRDYDSVFHVASVGNSMFFGSSAENTVTCIDARNGDERWVYFTDGPVRIAPTYSDGRLYFGSDDGFAYCLDAGTGELIWKFSPSPEEPLIPNNGAFISQWPVRTGVMLTDGTAYFGAGMLPWKNSYLCAVDAKTGSTEGENCFTEMLDIMTLEGAMLASDSRLYVTQGRVPPAVFDRSNGDFLGQLPGGGGVFALITPDSRIMHGPGNKTGWITESDSESRERIAQYPLGNAMLATEDRYYILTDTSLSAVDPETRDKLWTSRSNHPFTIIMAGNIIFAGGDKSVAAYNADDGSLLKTFDVDGRAHGLAFSRGRLYVSTDTGSIHCFSR